MKHVVMKASETSVTHDQTCQVLMTRQANMNKELAIGLRDVQIIGEPETNCVYEMVPLIKSD